ncbi:MAG: 4Fe-4S binding protein [Thermoleophilia bacterium]
MKRSTLNFILDSVIAIAFLICAVSGILFLLPASWLTIAGASRPNLLGVSYTLWRTLHDWSGVAMSLGIVVHLTWHYRWVKGMVRRFANGGAPARNRAETPRRESAPATAPAAGRLIAASRSATPVAGDAASSTYASHDRERRYTRRSFLTGTAVAGVAAVIGGVSLLSRSSSSLPGPQRNSTGLQPATWLEPGTSSQTDAPVVAAAQPTAKATLARVVVSQNSCISCGSCMGVCPSGVFAWGSDQRAVAANPDQCTLCRRCLQVCPANAITINA